MRMIDTDDQEEVGLLLHSRDSKEFVRKKVIYMNVSWYFMP